MSEAHIQQYHRLVYAAWLGCRFEGDALTRFRRLQAVYCGTFNVTAFRIAEASGA